MATIAKKTYVNVDESESRHASPNAALLRFDFSDGQVLTMDLSDLGESCRAASAWHGLAQKIGDSYAGADDASDAYDKAAALYERLCEDTWISAREGAGPRTSILAAAIVAVLLAAGRVIPDDVTETVKAKMELCKDKAYREKAASRPDVKAEMDRIKAERAAERAVKSAVEAIDVETETDSL